MRRRRKIKGEYLKQEQYLEACYKRNRQGLKCLEELKQMNCKPQINLNKVFSFKEESESPEKAQFQGVIVLNQFVFNPTNLEKFENMMHQLMAEDKGKFTFLLWV